MPKLFHILRSSRRRSGFSQSDIAWLIGISTHWSVSRHERRVRFVTLRTAIAYEVIYRKPVKEIFLGAYSEMRRTIQARAKKLLESLPSTGNADRDLQRKESLHAILARR